jgi:MFS family permease
MPLTSASAEISPTTASLHGLDGVNFFLAGVLAGFGPYVAVYLADQKWTQEKIGFVLSASALAGLLSQVPGGELLDSTRAKRVIVALGVLVVAVSAMIIEFRPTFPLVLIGLTLQGITGGIVGPAIAAITFLLRTSSSSIEGSPPYCSAKNSPLALQWYRRRTADARGGTGRPSAGA